MVDDFRRIKSCPGSTGEIQQLCDRAVTNTRQHVPVIVQRDRAEDALRATELRATQAEQRAEKLEAKLGRIIESWFGDESLEDFAALMKNLNFTKDTDQ
jgi:hypothetical protein